MVHRGSPRPGHRLLWGAPAIRQRVYRRAEVNPLRRATDRTRTRWLVAFILSCAIAVACGVMAGLTTMDSGLRAVAEQARHRHRVEAVTVGQAVQRIPNENNAVSATARVRWEFPPTSLHTATLPVPSNTPVGQGIGLWVTDAGEATQAPRTVGQLGWDAVMAGAGSAGLIVLSTGGAVFLRLRRVERCNLRQWERDWECVEPRWSGRLPGPGGRG
ncbi:Rv1733c family protein [Streptomyces aureus]|uniref:Rv1733c family protein n=1 Tax=Streptomyces aureus TaxID=193461 RepID=UPI003CD0BC63